MAPRIYGVLRHETSGEPLAGLTVRAFDKDLFRDQLLGTATSDGGGAYEIGYDPRAMTGPVLSLERAPDLYIEVATPDGRLVATSRNNVLRDAGPNTRIDLVVAPFSAGSPKSPWTMIAGQPVDTNALSQLSTHDLVATYAVWRGHLTSFARLDLAKRAFPRLFDTTHAPQCGLSKTTSLRRVLADRGEAQEDLTPFDGYPPEVTVQPFYTSHVVVYYTTMPGPHGVNPASPQQEQEFVLPGGLVIGSLQRILNRESGLPVPTYVQKVALLAQYAVDRLLSGDLALRDPRTQERLIVHIRDTQGAYGQTDAAWEQVEISPHLTHAQMCMTVPHEVFHRSQFQYHARIEGKCSFELSLLEGGARLFEEMLVPLPNRYVASAMEFLTDPGLGLTLIPSGERTAYAAGLFWKYLAEQHAESGSERDDRGFQTYRTVLEAMATREPRDPGVGPVPAAMRQACAALSPPLSFDRFHRRDKDGAHSDMTETVWGNFLLACALHGTPGNQDRRFVFAEDGQAVTWAGSRVASVSEARISIPNENDISLGANAPPVRRAATQEPYSAHYYRLRFEGAPSPEAIRASFRASGTGALDPLIQLVSRDVEGKILKLIRSEDRDTEFAFNVSGAAEVWIVVAGRETPFSYDLVFEGSRLFET